MHRMVLTSTRQILIEVTITENQNILLCDRKKQQSRVTEIPCDI